MNLYQELNDIFPNLLSIRKLESYVSIDVEFPTNWKLPKKYVDEKMVVEQKTDKPNMRCFSFATEFAEDKLVVLFNNLKNIIKYNKEREEKEQLFKIKIEELKTLFDKSKLDELKNLEFSLMNKIELEDEEGEDVRLVSESDSEG
jgi:hypothetical protein